MNGRGAYIPGTHLDYLDSDVRFRSFAPFRERRKLLARTALWARMM
jgi:hypothetical protein